MLSQVPDERPSVEAILKLPWLRRHLELYAHHMLQLSTLNSELHSSTASSALPLADVIAKEMADVFTREALKSADPSAVPIAKVRCIQGFVV